MNETSDRESLRQSQERPVVIDPRILRKHLTTTGNVFRSVGAALVVLGSLRVGLQYLERFGGRGQVALNLAVPAMGLLLALVGVAINSWFGPRRAKGRQ